MQFWTNYFLDFLKPLTYALSMGKRTLPAEFREYLAKIGRKGGKKGGPARAAKMTPEERRESARKAVLARWAKRKAKTAKSLEG